MTRMRIIRFDTPQPDALRQPVHFAAGSCWNRVHAKVLKVSTSTTATRAVLIALIFVGSATHAADMEDLSKLLDSGQYEAAYVRAVSQRSVKEGDPEFDFAYARAALQTGHYLEAVFALERVTTLDPGNHAARMDLGNAYAHLGNNLEAGKWYRSLLNHPEMGEQAAAALARVDTPFGMLGRKLRFWVDFSGGFDSNVNLGSGSDGILIDAAPSPTFFFPFPDSMQTQSARYHETRLGTDFIHEISPRRAVDAYISAGKKQNLGEDQFDQSQYALNTGYRLNVGRDSFRFAARYLQDDLNDKRLRYVWGVTGEYRAPGEQFWNAGWEQSILLGASRMEYPKQRDRGADQYVFGLSGNRKLGQTRHRVRVYLGDEQVSGDLDYLGRRFASVGWHADYLGMPRFSGWIREHLESITRDLTPLIYGSVPFIELGYTHSKNRGEMPALNERRLDRIFEVKAGAQTRISRRWEVRLELETRRANSNIEIYDHQRNLIRFGVRYDLH